MKSDYPETIVAAYNAIMESEVFRLDGPDIDLPAALITLAKAVKSEETDEFIWSGLGEHTEAPLGDLIAGAYWSLSEWHAGQSSTSYAALCALGAIFSPGCASGPEEESGEASAYEMCNQWFQEQADNEPCAL